MIIKRIYLLLVFILCLSACTTKEIDPSYFDRYDWSDEASYIAPEILDHPDLLMQDDYYNIVEDKSICGHWRSLNFREKGNSLKYDKYGDISVFYPSGIYVDYYTTSSGIDGVIVRSYKCDKNTLSVKFSDREEEYRYEISDDGNTLTIYYELNYDGLGDILERIE